MTLDPNSGAGTWTPTADEAGNTTVTIAATNRVGTSTLELNFPTYFTTAPGTPVATYATNVSGTALNNPTNNSGWGIVDATLDLPVSLAA